jgi:TP901 family phage tail tape measure protein
VSKEVGEAQKEMNSNLGSQGTLFGKLADSFNKYSQMAIAGIATIVGISMAFRKLAEDVAHMDDVYSDVMKTTNMTREQVVSLNEEFKKMDTRTSRESLNNLARDAGKLGLEGKRNILGFVEAGNQINVALGEDLGEGAITGIGKMVGVFKRSTKELQGLDLKEQMLSVGSAVNQLGASSSANEDYLVQFAGRLGGIAAQAGIGMDAILGFGSALDQDMQAVEMSATALQQFIMKLMAEPAKFAKLAGLEVGGFTKLLNTDANAAIKQVLRSLGDKGGFQALIPVFQEMGLDGARAVGVLSSMANSIDKIDEAQRVANKSMIEGTSITKEYDIKNNNMAARLDKAKKAFQETAFELGENLSPALLKSVKGTTYLIKGLVELPKWLSKNTVEIISIVTVWGLYIIAVNASTIADKLKVFWTGKVIESFKKLTLAIRANPWALIATGVILAVAWLNKYLNKQAEVNAQQAEFNKLAEETKELYGETKSLEDRAKAMQSLSKVQLESLKSDLESQVDLLQKHDAEIKTMSQKALDEDVELQNLRKKFFAAKSEMEKVAITTSIRWREEALLKALGNEYLKNKKSLDGLKNYLTAVDTLIKKKPKQNSSTPVDDKTALLNLDKALLAEQILLKNAHLKGKKTEEEYAKEMVDLQVKYLLLKKKIYAIGSKEAEELESQILDIKLKRQDDGKAALLKSKQESFKAISEATDSFEKLEKQKLTDKLNSKTFTQEQYENGLLILEQTAAQRRVNDAHQYAKQLETIAFASSETKKTVTEAANAAILSANEKLATATNAIAAKKLADEKEFLSQRKDLQERFGLNGYNSIASQYDRKLELLKKQLAKKLLTEEEFEKAKLLLKVDASEKYAQDAVGYADKVAGAVTAYHQFETDSLEAEKQKQLSIAGNDAGKREAIEKEYAQKELDLKKKQANANAGIQIAQAVAGGALAIIQAFAQLGPIGGAIAAVLLGATTAFQIGSILKQREVILNTTLDSSAGSSTTPTATGARVVNQAAEGRWDVVGADDGRVYRNVPYQGIARTGMITSPTLVGEQGTELIVDNPTLRNLQMNAPHVLETIRNHRVKQRASGNYSAIEGENNSSATNSTIADNSVLIANNTAIMNQVAALLNYLATNRIEAYTILSDFEKKRDLRDKSIAKGSLK